MLGEQLQTLPRRGLSYPGRVLGTSRTVGASVWQPEDVMWLI